MRTTRPESNNQRRDHARARGPQPGGALRRGRRPPVEEGADEKQRCLEPDRSPFDLPQAEPDADVADVAGQDRHVGTVDD